jgi:hypothetical protein
MPPRQAALHDTIETSAGAWLSPRRVLDGDYHTVFATAQHLRRLVPFRSVRDLMGFARKKPIRKMQPEVIEGGAGLSVHIQPDLIDAW